MNWGWKGAMHCLQAGLISFPGFAKLCTAAVVFVAEAPGRPDQDQAPARWVLYMYVVGDRNAPGLSIDD